MRRRGFPLGFVLVRSASTERQGSGPRRICFAANPIVMRTIVEDHKGCWMEQFSVATAEKIGIKTLYERVSEG